jgi:hypothetical protein
MPRSPRQVAIADHLWDAFARMAEEMGSDRDALVNQAMHVFARLNGFVVPGSAAGDGAGARSRASAVTPTPSPPPPGRRAVAERVLEAAERLERDMAARPPPVPEARSGALRLEREDGSGQDVAKERFLIGRGAHCDLVIDSGKISREHAAIVREADGWWIEDLGSSNGTWFRGERIQRRPVADGDEYFLCSEKVRCALR